jgi:hypothetical protein
MAAKRLAGGSSNIEALNSFVSALVGEDPRSADAALEAIKLKENEFGRGYRKALIGMRTALFEKNVDSLIYKAIKGGMLAKDRREIQNEFRNRRNTPFASEHEKGFYAAWKDVLRLVGTNLKSG